MKIAALDVDGTLLPGAVGLRLLRSLAGRGLADPEQVAAVFELLERYARGELERGAMVEQTTRRYAAAITGLERRRVEEVAAAILEETRATLFTFVPGLLADLSRRGFTTLLMTSSPEEIVAPLASALGVPAQRASRFTVHDGRYTGQVERMPGAPGEKRRIFEEFTRACSPAPEATFAMGNSLGDLSMLECVDMPLVFEPEPALRRIAEIRGWMIADRVDVLERIDALCGG